MAGSEKTLKAREFLFTTEESAVAILGSANVPPYRKVMWTILQLHYGDARVHFELQPQPSRGAIEIGLHFEGPAETNDAWAAYVAAEAGYWLGELGPGWELEAWTASWRRLHRSLPFTSLTDGLSDEAAHDLARLISVLGPTVAAGLPAAVHAGGTAALAAG